MSNLNSLKSKRTKATVLTALLLLALALPLLALPTASAAATVALSKTSGPNGTVIKVTGTGFTPNLVQTDENTPFRITVDGLLDKTDNFGSPLLSTAYLRTNATGYLTGYIIVEDLAPGQHWIQIAESLNAPAAIMFTITTPTVTLTPATGPAGTSVLVKASGFPTPVTGVTTGYIEEIIAATFAGTDIEVEDGILTDDAYELSSNFISTTSGSYTGTVTLPEMTTPTNPVFTMTDSWDNVARVTFALNTPSVTITPSTAAPEGLITAVVSGFAPGATFTAANVKVNVTAITGPLYPATPVANEQGIAVFMFYLGSGVDYAAGSKQLKITDSFGNVGITTITITQATYEIVSLGTATTNSELPIAPPSQSGVVLYIGPLDGFRANAPITVTVSPGLPSAWSTAGGSFANLVTNANGQVAEVQSLPGTTPANPGTYSITVSDGVNSIVTIVTIMPATGNYLALEPTLGGPGTLVDVYAFGTASVGGLRFDGNPLTATVPVATAWPVEPTPGSFVVPSNSAAGIHSVSAQLPGFNAPQFNVIGRSITILPSTAAVGSTVFVTGTGFANNPDNDVLQITVDGIQVPGLVSSFADGNFVASFSVPVLINNPHTVLVTDEFGNSATTSLTIQAASITTTATTVGTSTAALSITGTGFAAFDDLTITFDSSTMTPNSGLETSNAEGNILLLVVTGIPAAATAGQHTITVQGESGAYATATYTIVPKITLTPSAIRAGASVAITGTGFAASSALSVTVNGTAASWVDLTTSPPTVLTTAPTTTTVGSLPSSRGLVIPASMSSGYVTITVTDAQSNSASKNLTLLAPPAITLGATQVVAGVTGVSITGSGFSSADTRPATARLTDGTAITLTGAPVNIGSSGNIPSSAGLTFAVPASLLAGTYTLELTVGNIATPPIEVATATFTVLGAPVVIITPVQGKVGLNVTVNVVGLTGISSAVLGVTNVLVDGQFGTATVPTTGANAYNLTTWFLAPAIPAGTYTLALSDGVRFAQNTFTIVPSATVTPATGLRGSTPTVSGSGFAATAAFNVTLNGALAGSGTTNSNGQVSGVVITIPAGAAANSTIVITDAQGNTATAFFTAAGATLIVNPTTGAAGSTVQLIGSGFASQPILVQVNGAVVTTAPSGVTGPSFICYIVIPATAAGNVTITATDTLNNQGTATFSTSGGSTGFAIDTTTLASTAQTVNSAGQPTTTFARGSTVKMNFVLQTSTGAGNVNWRITIQTPDLSVLNIADTSASISTAANTLSYSQLLPANAATGTYRATIQIFSTTGAPIAVTTLNFTIA